jgi:hypothetical protein
MTKFQSEISVRQSMILRTKTHPFLFFMTPVKIGEIKTNKATYASQTETSVLKMPHAFSDKDLTLHKHILIFGSLNRYRKQ